MSWKSFEAIRRVERELQRRVYNILYDIAKKYSFHGVTFRDVIWEWEIDRRKADLVILDENNNPFLIIETKRKIEASGAYRVSYSFHVTDQAVIGQAISYVVLAKRRGLSPQFVATCNPTQIAIFRVPEDIDKLVNWEAIKRREYDRVIPFNLYRELVRGKYRVDTRDLELSERFFIALLEDLVDLAKGVKKVEEIAPLTFKVIRDLRGFVNWLAYNIEPLIREVYQKKESQEKESQEKENLLRTLKKELRKELEKLAKEKGYRPTPEQLAKEMAYVFMNKIIFYKVLERYWGKLPTLKPLLPQGIRSNTEYLRGLNEYFMKAIEVTKNFEPIFITGIYDLIPLSDDPEVLRGIDEFISYLEGLSIEKFSDVIGYVYEELIPAEERHILGQFYTSPPIAELIVKWCIRSPDDVILDPGCGSGTFLIQAYKRLYELKTGRKLEEVKYAKEEVHEKILEQLYGIDINEFPAHLTAMNLAMRNPRAPSTKMNVIVADFFSIEPCQEVLLPYRAKILGHTWKEELAKKVHIPKVDCIIGNPPYTRWIEIPLRNDEGKPIKGSTLWHIYQKIGDTLEYYGLAKGITSETGIYIPWIIHATKLLKEGGRLGMIISNAWLQTNYGQTFAQFLLDNFYVKAVIDFSKRLFKMPLVSTCVILLGKRRKLEKKENTITFIYVNKEVHISEILDAIQNPEKYRGKFIINTYKQSEIPKNKRWIELLFKIDDIINLLEKNEFITKLSKYFKARYGNIMGVFERGGTGGDKFFYIDEEVARNYKLLPNYVKPLIATPRKAPFFTLNRGDWKKLCEGRKKCYVFIAHGPLESLPSDVKAYIQYGMREKLVKPRRGQPHTVPESLASKLREKDRRFYGWYDLGGLIYTPLACVRRAWGLSRVILLLEPLEIALDEGAFIAFEYKEGVSLTNHELKALLAYLNSSFTQLFVNLGVTAGGGAGGLDIKSAEALPIIDIKKLNSKEIQRLSELFDKLDYESRKLGGADKVENIFGSELAKELTNKDVKPGIKGLWNTVIREIDYEVARILGFEEIAEPLRTILLELIRRRLARAGKARPETLKGTEELLIIEREEKTRRRKRKGSEANMKLDEFLKG